MATPSRGRGRAPIITVSPSLFSHPPPPPSPSSCRARLAQFQSREAALRGNDRRLQDPRSCGPSYFYRENFIRIPPGRALAPFPRFLGFYLASLFHPSFPVSQGRGSSEWLGREDGHLDPPFFPLSLTSPPPARGGRGKSSPGEFYNPAMEVAPLDIAPSSFFSTPLFPLFPSLRSGGHCSSTKGAFSVYAQTPQPKKMRAPFFSLFLFSPPYFRCDGRMNHGAARLHRRGALPIRRYFLLSFFFLFLASFAPVRLPPSMAKSRMWNHTPDKYEEKF